jgi:hypothetical protein
MRVALCVSVSSNVADLAALTVPNKFEYCMRHGYSLIVDNMPYEKAIRSTDTIAKYLDTFDAVWTLDADTLITDMQTPIHALDCLGPHATVCEEGIVEWNRINCGSVFWRNTPQTKHLLRLIAASPEKWVSLACGWQTWLHSFLANNDDIVTVAPLRAFNSCVWNRPANARDEIGGHWQPGDLVYHPCAVFPMEERISWIQQTLPKVLR